ncbi:MAG: hypothetical protein ABIN67_24925 [Ferruginibacter sp.]
MQTKYILSFLLVLSSSFVVAQEYSYQNKNEKSTETISFELKGNKIIYGEWEHVSNDPNTSGEMYGFTGSKINNKLVIIFTGTVPYTIPNSKRKAVWLLLTKVLTVSMKEKGKIKNVIFSVVQ